MISSIRTVWCDAANPADLQHAAECARWAAESVDAAGARKEARRLGWKRLDGKDYSPQCWELVVAAQNPFSP